MRSLTMLLPILFVACDSGSPAPPREVTVTPEQNITIMRDAEQGFIDLFVVRPSSAGSAELCYSLRLDNADQLVYALATPICTSVFGNDEGTLQYVLACDASTAENTISLWIHPPEGQSDFVNPCPAPSDGNGSEGPRSAAAGSVGPPEDGPEEPAEAVAGPSDTTTSHAFPSPCGAGNA